MLSRTFLTVILFVTQILHFTAQWPSLNDLFQDENQLTTKNYQPEQIHLSYGGKYVFYGLI